MVVLNAAEMKKPAAPLRCNVHDSRAPQLPSSPPDLWTATWAVFLSSQHILATQQWKGIRKKRKQCSNEGKSQKQCKKHSRGCP